MGAKAKKKGGAKAKKKAPAAAGKGFGAAAKAPSFSPAEEALVAQGKKLKLQLGFSHDVDLDVPAERAEQGRSIANFADVVLE